MFLSLIVCITFEAMTNKLFNPFLNFEFDSRTCFLSGEKVSQPDEVISVFPNWVLEKYALKDKPFKLLDESFITYKDLQIPASKKVIDAFRQLDEEVEHCFEQGYEGLATQPAIKIFQWIGRILYGTIVYEVKTAIRQQQATGEPLNFSQSLLQKFGNLHLMLQSLIEPIEFEGGLPWTIRYFKVDNAPDTFNYRDEINTLTFSIQLADFGIIACLQDNGANASYHKELLAKIDNQKLHQIQFQEVCGRFFYSNYLFNRLAGYNVMQTPDAIFIEPMPLQGMNAKPVFDHWLNKTYAQVLENFWKPWGVLLFEILKDPENPKSFLLDEKQNLIPSGDVVIPNGG